MKFPAKALTFFWLALATASPALGELAANYQAGLAGNPVTAPSPSTQDWSAGVPTSDTGNFQSAGLSPDGTTGLNAWRMLDNSGAATQFITWNKTLTAAQHSAAATYGWTMAARLRVVDPVSGNAGTNSIVLLYGNNTAQRFILFFDINATGEIVVSLVGSSSVTLTGFDPAAYHEHQLIFDPATSTATYQVDGVTKATGYAGTTGAYNGVQWGTGSSGGRGDGYWNSVSFVINDSSSPGGAGFLNSHSVAEGGNVTLSTSISGTVISHQWFKDTVALPGATSSSLTLTAVTPAQAGDYWRRTVLSTGAVVETNTAAVNVLTSGGGLTISEFAAENDSGDRDVDGEQSDWIELHNNSTSAISTAGYFLTDDALWPDKWALPAVNIPAGGFLRVWASGKDRSTAGQELHTNFSLANEAGGFLALVGADLSFAAEYIYPEQFADNSYGLTVHSPAREKRFTIPSPLALNTDGQTSVEDGISLTPEPGTFIGSTTVTLTSTLTGGALRYTTDGRLPTFDSTAYSTALNLNASTNLRAAMIFPGERFGATVSGAYLKLATDVQSFNSPLPILLVSNHGNGPVPGVSSAGPNSDGSDVVAVALQPQNVLVLNEPAGTTGINSPAVQRSRAGMKVRGSSSFSFAEKSYSLETWGERDNTDRDVSLLGMPPDSDWVIYGPDPAQFDTTLIHNSFAYALARQSGFPAPRHRFVELFVDTGGDLTMADHRGLAILVEKPSRGKDRVDVPALSADGTAGGWLINSDRMDALPPGTAPGTLTPRHFHTAGPDGILQTPNDNPRGFQGILTPGGSGSGGGIGPANDDMPNYYHSFFNFESPSGWNINSAQRTVIENSLHAFDAALYGPNYANLTTGYWPHIDVPNWAHHLALHTLTRNQDACVLSSFLSREGPATPFRWAYVWDFDRAYDRMGTATANLNWAHDRLYYQRLVTDLEFMQAYIDKWQELRRGPFSNVNMTAIVDAQAAEITSTVAARSGLTASSWSNNLIAMKNWLTARGAAIDATQTPGPVPSHPGGSVPSGYNLSLTSTVGTIYYSTDGSDPRLRGGSVAPGATTYTGSIEILTPTALKARVKNGASWSGLLAVAYFPPQDLATLRITEIYYNPPAQSVPFVDGEEFEFLELKNTGTVPLDVSGMQFTAGIVYTIPANSIIPGGGFYLLARNSTAFTSRFPTCTPHGTYAGKLKDEGETLTLSKAGETILTLTYARVSPWRSEPDGGGMSLQRPNATAPGYDPITWTAAAPTPCADLSLADFDNDGLPDYFEALHGPTNGAADNDGDGESNAAEYLAGTDHTNPASVFALRAISAAPDQIVIEFTALAGRAYTVQTSTDLQAWQTFQQVPAGPMTRAEQLLGDMSEQRRYYRAITPPQAPAATGSTGEAVLAPVFTNGMVLQRDQPLPIWGTAPPGEEVTVTLGSGSVARFADALGNWKITLPPQSVSIIPRTVTISLNGQTKVQLQDVLIGDVWLCAGQSNMEFRCNQESSWPTEQANANLPHLRLYNMGFAGQGVGAVAYSTAVVARQTPADFYNATSWTASTPATAATFSAVGYFFGRELLNAQNIPIGLLHCSVGGSPAEAWMRREILPAAMTMPNWTANNANLEAWCNGRALDQLGANFATAPGDDMGPNHSFKPGFLWSAGPARLLPYAIKGVIWYQGESNALSHIGEPGVTDPAWRVQQHESLFPTLVNDWRAQWGQGDFPFLICQLSSISETGYDSHYWPEFRDQQRRAARDISNMGFAVTSDIGNATNVHPTNKRDVGKRLARWAQRNVYGDTGALACPMPTSAVRSGATVTVSFDNAVPALATSNGQPPASFQLAGADGIWHSATATIAGSTISVTSTSVPVPVQVRYGWQPFSLGNVVNADGLPASTFQLSVAS